ncbi:hypothetical protein ABZX74_15580 [Streptomyces olivaceoviridis]|uniref:hypothetical protein n=1 Tax=Streptomyces olivaceoviridis TaxID=1921 RepID=UPI0033ABD3B7
MPVYETQSELDAAEADYRRRRTIEDACKATGQPCQHIGNHHVEAAHRRGLHLRAANGMFYSTRYVTLLGCRWCGLDKRGHCGGAPSPRGLHEWERPTGAQLQARKIAAGLDPNVEIPFPPDPQPYESECRCDRGDEDAEPCAADDCVVAELIELGTPH